MLLASQLLNIQKRFTVDWIIFQFAKKALHFSHSQHFTQYEPELNRKFALLESLTCLHPKNVALMNYYENIGHSFSRKTGKPIL